MFARNYLRDDAETSRRIQAAIGDAYAEDFVALEAQQRSLLNHEPPWRIDVNADAGHLAGRALHDRFLEAERAAQTRFAAE